MTPTETKPASQNEHLVTTCCSSRSHFLAHLKVRTKLIEALGKEEEIEAKGGGRLAALQRAAAVRYTASNTTLDRQGESQKTSTMRETSEKPLLRDRVSLDAMPRGPCEAWRRDRGGVDPLSGWHCRRCRHRDFCAAARRSSTKFGRARRTPERQIEGVSRAFAQHLRSICAAMRRLCRGLHEPGSARGRVPPERRSSAAWCG